MVYIHGGAFMVGSSAEYGSPAPLMQKDIVLVTMNYRLGALGMWWGGEGINKDPILLSTSSNKVLSL